jgi:hypothetical protein
MAKAAQSGVESAAVLGVSSMASIWGLPGRVLLDTNVINTVYDEGDYISDGDSGKRDETELDPELVALRKIFEQARRQQFPFVTSPLSVAEVVNIQGTGERRQRLGWFLEMLDYWTIELDQIGDRQAVGGTVRHRFKLSGKLQALEQSLLQIDDFRRDSFDRLLLIHSRMANCDAFFTFDRNSLWRHRNALAALGIVVVVPTEYHAMVVPYAGL